MKWWAATYQNGKQKGQNAQTSFTTTSLPVRDTPSPLAPKCCHTSPIKNTQGILKYLSCQLIAHSWRSQGMLGRAELIISQGRRTQVGLESRETGKIQQQYSIWKRHEPAQMTEKSSEILINCKERETWKTVPPALQKTESLTWVCGKIPQIRKGNFTLRVKSYSLKIPVILRLLVSRKGFTRNNATCTAVVTSKILNQNPRHLWPEQLHSSFGTVPCTPGHGIILHLLPWGAG